MAKRGTVAERLDRLSMPEPNSGCVLWLGYLGSDGYGRFTVSARARAKIAHLVAYETLVGPVPPGLELDHLCRNRACIAYWHLEPVTHQVNVLRGVGVAAQHAAKVACIEGHPFDAANTYADRRGWRGCNACRRAASRRQRLRLKAVS